MSGHRDPGIRLFGRVIPLAAEIDEPARVDKQSELPPPPAPEDTAAADEVQHKERDEKEDSETKSPQEEDDKMKIDAPEAEKETEVKVDAQEEEKETEMKVDAPEEDQEIERKADVQPEEEVEETKVNAPQEIESVELDKSATSPRQKDDNGQMNKDDKWQMNNDEDKAAPDLKEEENGITANDESGQDKTLKKPDKILPCPRCNSMDTKFCYYNNYNVNQPRHFCKNCQRYWTAGGTMRNVPVGAGRRKSKNSTLHYRQLLMAPDCMMGSRVDISKTLLPEALASSSSTPIHATSRNETVLKFGTEVPFCESMVSALNIEEQNGTNTGSAPQGENREGNACASSVTSYNEPSENTVQLRKNGAPVYCNGVAPVPQYYLGAPFMYPWNVGWNNIPVMAPGRTMPESASPPEGCNTSTAPWMNSTMMPPSRLPGPAFPYPLMPPALWGSLSGWPATSWNIPWIRTNGCLSPSSSSNSSCSGNGSPTLGKHSRDPNPLKEDKEKSLWVPKTLRIDDPDEAAKSSIWATLGIKPGDPGTFKPFQYKVEKKGQTTDAAPVLQANPAALSRSQSFQESS